MTADQESQAGDRPQAEAALPAAPPEPSAAAPPEPSATAPPHAAAKAAGAATPARAGVADVAFRPPTAAAGPATAERADTRARHRQRRLTGGPGLARRLAIVEDAGSRWPLGRIIGAGMATLITLLVAATVVGAIAISSLDGARSRVVSVLDPAALHGSRLYSALLNQETGLRGYLLSAQRPYLQPYVAGTADQAAELRALQPLLAGLPAARADLSVTVRRIDSWRSSYAAPAIARVAASGRPLLGGNIAAGKAEFDGVRTPMAAFQRYVADQRTIALAHLGTATTVLDITAIAIAVVLLLGLVALGVGLRAAAIRPLARLASDARQVAGGDLEHEVDPSGPREVHTLAVDVDRMRERVLRELSAVRAANAALQARAHELERSNSELEQFAYVASHDLQEPLRKVASFCQLLQRRYIGQLDARADQYIEFAVDGAKRMQALIDDLLAFSRVGRFDRELVLVSCASALSEARVNLGAEIRASHAVIESTELPLVRAEFSLLTSVFQNLLGNALKFRSDEPPVIKVSATLQGDSFWLFSVSDNGIGIEPEFAERIFVIFQRLHSRSDYAGTGIGLAMTRKVIEHYGGSIWLDTTYQGGAHFCFTLPVAPDDDEEPSL
jgi:signal transduction histidine kinase